MLPHYAVAGNPVSHSLSPLIHAFFAKSCHEALIYDRLLIPEGTFAATAGEFFAKGGLGLNITVPCKLDAFKFADKLTPYAEHAGAVNTLKRMPDGTFLGDNTDGRGLCADLQRLGAPLKGSRVLVIGAGGAVQGILAPLLESGISSLHLTNRTLSKAQHLAQAYAPKAEAIAMNELKPEYEVIINASSSSLKGQLPAIADDVIAKASFVYDLMYTKQGRTIFTDHALKLGVSEVHDGIGMLIMQAALSYELWRGVRPDAEAAIEYLRQELKA